MVPLIRGLALGACGFQAVGADLEIRAVFPDGRGVKITPVQAR